MHLVRIFKSIFRRLKNALSVFFFANNYYLFEKEKYDFLQYHFSQEGEDIVFWKIINSQPKGFYVDVGAHHPQRLSNTHLLYLKGWRGINIDPLPGSKNIFDKIRPHDLNIECGISSRQGKLMYYKFEEPLLNTFSENLMLEYISKGNIMVDSQQINTFTLSSILNEQLPVGMKIDLLTVDVEGLDIEVLMSNDWAKFRPQYIIVEDLGSYSLKDLMDSDVYNFLASKDYEAISKLHNSVIFHSKN